LAGFARHRLKFLTLTFVPVFAKQIEQMLTVMRSKQANNKDLCRYVIRSTCFPTRSSRHWPLAMVSSWV